MILAKAQQEEPSVPRGAGLLSGAYPQATYPHYAYLGEMRASTNPAGVLRGGFYGGPSQAVGQDQADHENRYRVVRHYCASTRLQELWPQRQISTRTDSCPGNTAVYINDKVEQFIRTRTDNLFILSGTPRAALQVECRAVPKYGIIEENVSDRPYVIPNSFHCHVTEDITPIQKQDLRRSFLNLSNGGKIRYVKPPD